MVEDKVHFAILEALKRPFRHFFRQGEKKKSKRVLFEKGWPVYRAPLRQGSFLIS